jgi:putative flippase GtrA
MSPELNRLAYRFVKFAGVGAIGTAGHYITLFLLVHVVALDAVIASSAGFLVGAIINYVLNYKFTFRSRQSHSSTAPKFFAIALGGFFLNGAAMALFVNKIGLYYLLAQVITTGLILIWTFLANHYWTFGETTRNDESG